MRKKLRKRIDVFLPTGLPEVGLDLQGANQTIVPFAGVARGEPRNHAAIVGLAHVSNPQKASGIQSSQRPFN